MTTLAPSTVEPETTVVEILVRVDLYGVVGRALPLAFVEPDDDGLDRLLRRPMIKPPEQRVIIENRPRVRQFDRPATGPRLLAGSPVRPSGP